MARPTKDRKLTDAKLASAIEGILRVVNTQIEACTNQKLLQGLKSQQAHLLKLHASLSNPAATIRPTQRGSRLLPYSCLEGEGCGYKVRVTGLWVSIAVPICPNPECRRFQKPMEFMGEFFRAEKHTEESEEKAREDHKAREEAIKEIEDFFGKDSGDLSHLERKNKK